MNRSTVARVVGLVYLSSGRHLNEDVIDAWQAVLSDVEDGSDVLDVTRRLVRQVDGLVTARDVRMAVTAARARVAELEPRSGRELVEKSPEAAVVAEWLRRCRAVLSGSHHRPADYLGRWADLDPDDLPSRRRVDEDYWAGVADVSEATGVSEPEAGSAAPTSKEDTL